MRKIILSLLFGLFCLSAFAQKNEKTNLLKWSETQPDTHFVQLEKGKTFYQDVNKNGSKTILFVHGGTIPSWSFDPIFNALKQNKKLRLIRYDMYGRGLTSSPKAVYERKFYLKQLEELIDHLNITKIDTLIGVSFGASLSTLFTLKHPEKISKTLYVSPAVNWLGNHGLSLIHI